MRQREGLKSGLMRKFSKIIMAIAASGFSLNLSSFEQKATDS